MALISSGVFYLYSYLLVQQTSPTNYFNLASLLAVLVVGACAGFLPLNWHPAKLFMGDAGALLVGLLMATSANAASARSTRRYSAPTSCSRPSSRSSSCSRCS